MKPRGVRFLASTALAVCLVLGPGAPPAPAAEAAPAGTPAPAAAPAPASAPAGALLVKGTPSEGPIGLRHYLAVSALVFSLGLAVIVIRRNAIAVLMGIELMLNAAGLNFVAFSKYVAKDIIDGQTIAIFLIVIAAAEAAVALAIILNIFQNMNTVTVDEADELKG